MIKDSNKKLFDMVIVWKLDRFARNRYKTRTTKGKSLLFLILIFLGYICGITGKLMAPSFKWYVLFFYLLNFVMVGADLLLYVRNYRMDKQAEQSATQK